MMRRGKQLLGIVAIVIIIAIVFVDRFLKRNTFETDWHFNKKYCCAFQDSVIQQIDTICYTSIYKRDVCLSVFNILQKNLTFYIWDIKSIQSINYQSIVFKPNDNPSLFQLGMGETQFKYECPEIKAPFKIHFENHLNVSTDKFSKVLFSVETNYCKGVYGEIKNISFNDGKNDPIVMNLETEHVYSMILAYKIRNKTLLILIVSRHPFDKSVLNLFKKEI